MIQDNASVGKIYIRKAATADIDACKKIADHHRDELGFLPKPAFVEAADRESLLIAETAQNQIVGFVRYNHRKRGTETAIYDIAVLGAAQRQGVGSALVDAVSEECREKSRTSIILKCPEMLGANQFYEKVGFEHVRIDNGRRRRLIVWRLNVGSTQ